MLVPLVPRVNEAWRGVLAVQVLVPVTVLAVKVPVVKVVMVPVVKELVPAGVVKVLLPMVLLKPVVNLNLPARLEGCRARKVLKVNEQLVRVGPPRTARLRCC